MMRCGVALLVLLLGCGVSSASAEVSLSDEELDQVSAQGFSFTPFSVSANTTTNTFIPVSITTIVNTNTITNTNTALQVCTFSLCSGPAPTIVSTNSIPTSPAIASPQVNTFLSSVQAPTLTNFNFPLVGTSTPEIPSVRVPAIQVPVIQVPSVRFP